MCAPVVRACREATESAAREYGTNALPFLLQELHGSVAADAGRPGTSVHGEPLFSLLSAEEFDAAAASEAREEEVQQHRFCCVAHVGYV
jgi:hypothetical protein